MSNGTIIPQELRNMSPLCYWCEEEGSITISQHAYSCDSCADSPFRCRMCNVVITKGQYTCNSCLCKACQVHVEYKEKGIGDALNHLFDMLPTEIVQDTLVRSAIRQVCVSFDQYPDVKVKCEPLFWTSENRCYYQPKREREENEQSSPSKKAKVSAVVDLTTKEEEEEEEEFNTKTFHCDQCDCDVNYSDDEGRFTKSGDRLCTSCFRQAKSSFGIGKWYLACGECEESIEQYRGPVYRNKYGHPLCEECGKEQEKNDDE